MVAIPPRWLIERRLDQVRPDRVSGGARAEGSRPRFHRLPVAAVERLTEDAIAVTFAVPSELAQAYRFAAGQHVSIRTDHGGPGTRRSYSIASPAPDGPLRIGIKCLPGGAFSGWAVDRLRAGAELEVSTPTGSFGGALEPPGRAKPRHVVGVAAGSGITPVYSIAASVLAGDPDSGVTLLYGNRSTDTVMFLEDLEDLKNRHPHRLQLLHFLSREPQAVALRAGRLDSGKVRTLLGVAGDPGAVPRDADAWFLCGPAAAVQEWRSSLVAAGVDPGRIHRELFHADPPLGPAPASSGAGPPESAGPTRRVEFVLDGRTSEIRVAAGETVLDGVLRVRPDAPFACRGGVCGTCRATVLQGGVQMAANFALEGDELAAGLVLTCQARPTTDTVILDYDR